MKTTAPVLPSPTSFGAPAAAASRAAPPWPVLALLAGLVLLIHTLVLGAAPLNFSTLQTPAPQTVAVMMTRSLPPPPLPPVAAAQPRPAAPPAQATPKSPPETLLAAAQKAPTPAPAPVPQAPPTTPETSDEQPSSSADLFAGLEQGGPPEETPAPSAQNPPKAPPVSIVAAATPAAPPSSPSQHLATTVTAPASTKMDYRITGRFKGLTYHAKGELLWRNNGSTYQTLMTISALLGSRSMDSQGQLSAEGLAPTRFADKARSEVAAHFEPGKGQISFSANTPSVPWAKGVQDRASVLIQLGAMLAGKPAAFPVGTRIVVYTVGPRSADNWTFLVEGGEVLSLPFGELATLKLSRQLRYDDDKKLELWYAPALGYLPVRNKISETNGDFVDQQLSAVSKP